MSHHSLQYFNCNCNIKIIAADNKIAAGYCLGHVSTKLYTIENKSLLEEMLGRLHLVCSEWIYPVFLCLRCTIICTVVDGQRPRFGYLTRIPPR